MASVAVALCPGASVIVACVAIVALKPSPGSSCCTLKVNAPCWSLVLVTVKSRLVATACFFSFRMPKLRFAGSKVALTVAALARSTRPAPIASRPAFVVLPEVVKTAVAAELINADFTCAGVHVGCCWTTSAAEPATCGVAWLVPRTALNPDGSSEVIVAE